ncbi:MAG: cyclic 2,3-diphosphoglycerate synthase [Deltaproteobacteria bacterium]|nr:cyclic 2,3-diphosphoglycerate synthase [Deltaproteobacteria bacterium]
MRKRVIIMGAGGRDFHNFNLCFRNNPDYEVVAFTAAQIPFIEHRIYPPELGGPLYPKGIQIFPEEELSALIRDKEIDEVVFSYSDVSYEYVMHRASLVNSLGARFSLLGPDATMIKSSKLVISVCAVRTGCGKSGVTRLICRILKEMGKKVGVVRHPMAYRDLLEQRAQRFSSNDDLKGCTIEEREEFEPLIEAGVIVYAGVDYSDVLREAEKEGDIIVWDGGNNDLPFIKPDLEIVVLDPHRPGHELLYYPGEANFRRADCLIINKMDTAKSEDVQVVLKNIKEFNPYAKVVYTSSPISVEDGEAINGKRVLVVEDGPTVIHGGMTYGAGVLAARRFGAKELVDPGPHAVGSIKEALEQYPGIWNLLPAMGYGDQQIRDLGDTINNTPCDIVIIATPVDLRRIISIKRPSVRVRYEVEEMGMPNLRDLIEEFIKG